MLIKFVDMLCSLDYAIRLRELGVKQLSYFYWCVDIEGNAKLWQAPLSTRQTHDYSAFSLHECVILMEGSPYEFSYQDRIEVMQKCDSINYCDKVLFLLIYLIENKLITIEDINDKFDKVWCRDGFIYYRIGENLYGGI